MASKKNLRLLTYRITDRDSCESAIRSAVVFYFFGAGVGAILAALDILKSGPALEQGTAGLLDLMPLAFCGLTAVLALRVHQHKSRVAATLLFAILVVDVLISYMHYGIAASRSLVMQLFLGFTYFQGMRGTYLWHSKYQYAPLTPEVVSVDGEAAAGSAVEPEHRPSAQPRDDLCPQCFEYFAPDELTCRYCGADLRSRSSPTHA